MARRTYIKRSSLEILLTQVEYLSKRLNSFEKKELALQLRGLGDKFSRPLDKEDELKAILRDFFGVKPNTGFTFEEIRH